MMIKLSIKINPVLAKMFLFLNLFPKFILVAKGYNEDFLNYTELIRRDDLNNLFSEYSDFQIWQL